MTERPRGGEDGSPSAPEPPSPGAGEDGLSPEEEPTTTGTLFVMLLFLMALAGMWALMYMVLLER